MDAEAVMLAIGADASPASGAGHVMRCVALAEAWIATGGAVTFVSHRLPVRLAGRIADLGAALVEREAELGAIARTASEVGADWNVLDSYQATVADHEAARASGARLLVIDDHGHAGRYAADVVLDQNLDADPAVYAGRAPGARLLLGSRYALIRREFQGLRRPPGGTGTVEKVFVSLGGAPAPETMRLVLAGILAALPEGAGVVVAPGVTGGPEEVWAGDGRVTVADPGAGLAALMAGADLAVTAAGSTVWELAFLGVPSILVTTAANQRPLATRLAAHGAGLDLGWDHDLDPATVSDAVAAVVSDAARRASMVRAGQDLVDGNGADRVVVTLRQATMHLEDATVADAEILWEWANDPATRASSFSSEPIPWSDHRSWFDQRLGDPGTHIYLAHDRSGLVGQIRFQVTGEVAEVSVNVAPRRRGHRLGSALVAAGTARLFGEHPVGVVEALIKAENIASIRAFTLAGYEPVGRSVERGPEVLRFTRHRDDG